MISLALRFAAVLSVLIGLVNIVYFECTLRDINAGKNIAGFLSLSIMITGLFLGMKYMRTHVYKGLATYGQSFYSGIVIALFTAIGAGLITLIYMQFIRPDYTELLIPVMEKSMKAHNFGDKEIAEQIAIAKTSNVASSFVETVFKTILFMLIVSSILASFIRTKDTFSTENES